MKILGVFLIMGSCVVMCRREIYTKRTNIARIQELSAALLAMETEIRWKKGWLSAVIAHQKDRRLCGEYFKGLSEAINQGKPAQTAWNCAFVDLQPEAAKECLIQIELSGDEMHLMGSLRMAAEQLQRLRQELMQKQRQDEKLQVVSMFSAASILIVLLW